MDRLHLPIRTQVCYFAVCVLAVGLRHASALKENKDAVLSCSQMYKQRMEKQHYQVDP